MEKFKRNVFSQGQTLFTQLEFDQALAEAKDEIMGYAMRATSMAIIMEREACAKMAGGVQQEKRNAPTTIVRRMPRYL